MMCVESRYTRPKGWLVCLAISKDLKTWEKKGPILDFGKPGSVCTERVTGMDFYPTFLEAAGLLKEMQAQLPVPNPNYDATRPAILTRQTALGMAAEKRLLEESQLRSLAAPSIDKNQDP